MKVTWGEKQSFSLQVYFCFLSCSSRSRSRFVLEYKIVNANCLSPESMEAPKRLRS